jgi:hypothetical protein
VPEPCLICEIKTSKLLAYNLYANNVLKDLLHGNNGIQSILQVFSSAMQVELVSLSIESKESEFNVKKCVHSLPVYSFACGRCMSSLCGVLSTT